jgi:hypothetical protein
MNTCPSRAGPRVYYVVRVYLGVLLFTSAQRWRIFVARACIITYYNNGKINRDDTYFFVSFQKNGTFFFYVRLIQVNTRVNVNSLYQRINV